MTQRNQAFTLIELLVVIAIIALYLDWHVEWLAAEDITADLYRFQK